MLVAKLTAVVIAFFLAACLTACGLGESEPAGPSVVLSCAQDQTNGNTIIDATNNCDKSTRTAEPFVIEPVIVMPEAE